MSVVVSNGVLNQILLENGFGGLALVNTNKRIYKSLCNGLVVYIDHHTNIIEFEVEFGRVDGRNEILKRLRDNMSNEYKVSDVMYGLGVYEDNIFVYNSVRFIMTDVAFIDDKNWNNQLIKYYEYIYDYETKKIIEYEAVCWFGMLNIQLYHPQCSPRYYNAIVEKNNHDEVYERFLRELSVLNDALSVKSCSNSSICSCEELDVLLLRVSSLSTDDSRILISNIDCAKRSHGVYSVRKEMLELISEF